MTAEDLPAEQLPGLSDLPADGTGLPTSLLTNEAVLGLAFGAAPKPCEVSDPLADPVVDPAVTPGEDEPVAPTVDPGQGTPRFEDGFRDFRRVQAGSTGDGPVVEAFYVTTLTRDYQGARQRLDAGDGEYEHFLLESREGYDGETASGTFDTAVRDGYAGVGGTAANDPGTTNGTASLRIDTVGGSAGVSITCTPSGCQPDYTGLPKLGDLPTVPNPLADAPGTPV